MHTKERRRSYPGGTRRCQDCDGTQRREHRCHGRPVRVGGVSGTMYRNNRTSRTRESGARYRDNGTHNNRESGTIYKDVGTTMHRESGTMHRDNGARIQRGNSILYRDEGANLQRELSTAQDKPQAGWCSNSEILCRVFTAYLAVMLGWAVPQVSLVN